MITTKATTNKAITERERNGRRLAYQAAVEGIVLLENDGTLPITPRKIALFGAGAQYTIKGGSGSGEVNVRHTVTVKEGLEKAGFTITTQDWIRRYDKIWKEGKEIFLQECRKKLFPPSTKVLADLMAAEYRYPAGDLIREDEIAESGTDTCLYVLSRQSGEGHDRGDLAGSFRLEQVEIENIRLCAERYARFILIINTGASMDLSPLDEITGIGAIVYMGQLGMEGGRALTDVLTGKRTPSGKLAVTWPKRYEDVPFGNEFGIKDGSHALYKEGIYVGYRYYNSFHIQPRYPFGFGLSYTTFSLETASITLLGTNVNCEVKVRNTGIATGKEVVQVYVSCPQSGLEKEYQRLVSFGKTATLAPGESEILHLQFPVSYLSVYDEKAAKTVLEKGDYIIRVGQSSVDTQATAVLQLAEDIVLSVHRNMCSTEMIITKLHAEAGLKPKAEIEGLPVLRLKKDLFETVHFSYEKKEERFHEDTEAFLDSFTALDMAKFCSGTGLFGENRGFSVPGAVGHTTTDYLDRGIPNIELCDGPAGLRIQRRSTRAKNGKIKPLDTSISLYEMLPNLLTKFILGNPRKEEVLYQFVTGFPVAAMVAQSWNTELARRIGRAVSMEMSEYGVSIWLAPALNIVRNPLCGRNYEYYSEDPVLSGKFAAAITGGVQETPGNYVTIKHFAVNNQEENRYYVSSDLDERVLREIYLRGFEIAVRDGKPRFVMTAYNRINGSYCANSMDLCTEILRNEWKFSGAVMTDWLSTGEDRADAAAALRAGVDLIMPGGKSTVSYLKKAMRNGGLSGTELRRSCGRVLDLILYTERLSVVLTLFVFFKILIVL